MNSLSWWAVILSFAGISSDILPGRQYPLVWDTLFCWLPATAEYSIALLWGQDNVKRLKIVHVQFLNCIIYGVVHAILGNRDTHPLSSLLAQKLAPPPSLARVAGAISTFDPCFAPRWPLLLAGWAWLPPYSLTTPTGDMQPLAKCPQPLANQNFFLSVLDTELRKSSLNWQTGPVRHPYWADCNQVSITSFHKIFWSCSLQQQYSPMVMRKFKKSLDSQLSQVFIHF